jgi:hypothetical protein
MTLPPPVTPARQLAESFFKKADVPVVPEYETQAQKQRQLTAQLRRLRLAKEQADKATRRDSPI